LNSSPWPELKGARLKYDNENIAKSAEYLRQALPLMSRQAAALHPVSYAVWYEYVSGSNQALRASVDEYTRDGAVLDEKTTAELFRKHIAELDEDLVERVSNGFQKIMTDMSESASEAGDHANHFGNALEKWSEDLTNPQAGEEAGTDVLLRQTREMQGSIAALNLRLDESRREIGQLRQEVSKAREDALADGLTGLMNRRGFDLALTACLTKPESDDQDGPSLLLIDIDHFKRVNDSYGHLFGDKVIRAMAQILKNNVKGKDTAVRYGGEEFVILLPDTPLDGAHHLAETIRSAVERFRIKRTDSNEAVATITVSLGVASYRDGESGNDLVARADAAMYASKKQGRNRVTVAAAGETD
jgi:diguanylate cyclase